MSTTNHNILYFHHILEPSRANPRVCLWKAQRAQCGVVFRRISGRKMGAVAVSGAVSGVHLQGYPRPGTGTRRKIGAFETWDCGDVDIGGSTWQGIRLATSSCGQEELCCPHNCSTPHLDAFYASRVGQHRGPRLFVARPQEGSKCRLAGSICWWSGRMTCIPVISI